MPIVSVRGADLHYLEHGEGIHRVVFLHDLLQSSAIWRPLIESLSGDTFRCLAFDLKGYGASSRPDHGYTVDWLADDIRHALHELGIARCSVVAAGLGGAVAISMAARYPHLVYKLAVTGACAVARDRRRALAEASRLGEIEWGKETIAAEIEKQYGEKPAQDFFEAMVEEALKANRDAVLATAAAYAQTNLLDLLPRMQARTLIIVGGKDPHCTQADGELLQLNISQSEIQVLPDAGHAAMIDSPELFREHMLELLNRI